MLDFSHLTIKLLLLFLPGIIAASVVEFYTKSDKKDWKIFLLSSYLFAIFAYLIHYSFSQKSRFFENIFNSTTVIDGGEIISVSIIGLLLGILLTYLINYRLLYSFGFFIKMSNKFGDEEVWHKIISDDKRNWITVTDRTNDLVYLGIITLYSTQEGKRELVLKDVDIYNDDGDYLYTQELIYFDLKNEENLVLEFGKSYENSIQEGIEENE